MLGNTIEYKKLKEWLDRECEDPSLKEEHKEKMRYARMCITDEFHDEPSSNDYWCLFLGIMLGIFSLMLLFW